MSYRRKAKTKWHSSMLQSKVSTSSVTERISWVQKQELVCALFHAHMSTDHLQPNRANRLKQHFSVYIDLKVISPNAEHLCIVVTSSHSRILKSWGTDYKENTNVQGEQRETASEMYFQLSISERKHTAQETNWNPFGLTRSNSYIRDTVIFSFLETYQSTSNRWICIIPGAEGCGFSKK